MILTRYLQKTTMPPKSKRKYDQFFLMITLSVEKKINQLGTYLESLEQDGHTCVSIIQQRMLTTHIDRLRKAVDKLEAEWSCLRDDIPQADLNRVHAIVDKTSRWRGGPAWGGNVHMPCSTTVSQHGTRAGGWQTFSYA